MKWTCADCSDRKTEAQSIACPSCCGFTSVNEFDWLIA